MAEIDTELSCSSFFFKQFSILQFIFHSLHIPRSAHSVYLTSANLTSPHHPSPQPKSPVTKRDTMVKFLDEKWQTEYRFSPRCLSYSSAATTVSQQQAGCTDVGAANVGTVFKDLDRLNRTAHTDCYVIKGDVVIVMQLVLVKVQLHKTT